MKINENKPKPSWLHAIDDGKGGIVYDGKKVGSILYDKWYINLYDEPVSLTPKKYKPYFKMPAEPLKP